VKNTLLRTFMVPRRPVHSGVVRPDLPD